MTKRYVIGIGCVGSGVGQSVINSCRLSRLPIRTLGLGNNPFAYGAYDCDVMDYTPTIYADKYVDELIRKCKEHCVDLFIPCVDDEVLICVRNMRKFQDAEIKVIAAGEGLVELCRDKERLIRELGLIADVFVKAYDRTTLREDIASGKVRFPFIAKPRGGFASRGIEIISSEADLGRITDNHIAQELAIPDRNDPNHKLYVQQLGMHINPQLAEISIELVADQYGALIGRMASYNRLLNGVPIEIVPIEDARVWDVVDRLTPCFRELGWRGPLNMQGRITENGLKLFEINPRFTGVTGLRALMGFNEVEACIGRWLMLDDQGARLEINHRRFGVRQAADKSIPIEWNERVKDLAEKLQGGRLDRDRIILCTGATGYLGRNFVTAALKENEYEIWLLSRDKASAQKSFGSTDICHFDKDDLDSGRLPLGHVDVLLHLAFARPHRAYGQIADSLDFTEELFTRAGLNQVPAVINISSQSVYGLDQEPPWSEQARPAPQTVYAQAKYASELMLRSLARVNNQFRHTSLRLASLAGGQQGLVPTDLVTKFVEQALRGEAITIHGGTQQVERLDVRDAVTALLALIAVPSERWQPVYNVGADKTCNIKDIAALVVNTVQRNTGRKASEIVVKPAEMTMKLGMDSSLFIKDTGWSPSFSMADTVSSLVDYLGKTTSGLA